MKSGIHPASQLVKFSCISCAHDFEVYSSNSKNLLKMDVCGNCHPFYTGRSSSEVKTGKIEVFKQRERKTQAKKSLK